MFIQITDPGDNTRILLNEACIMMVRCSAQGGSTIYLSTSASHHPDVLLARETPEQIIAKLAEHASHVEATDGVHAPTSPLPATAAH